MSKNKGTYTVAAVAGQAEICLKGLIYDWDSRQFERDVQALIDQGINTGKIFIDSWGGDAMAAQRIGNAIDRFPGKLDGEIGVLAASNASYIAAKCKKLSIASNGQIMIHKPSLVEGGNLDELTARIKLLRNITKDFSKVYAAKMGKTDTEIEQMWKEDYWMSAEEALAEGFVDEILEAVEPDAEVVAELRSVGRWAEPQVTAQTTPSTNTNNDNMKNSLVLAALELPENSDETAVLKAVQKLVSTNKQLESKVTALETAAQEQKEGQVKALVEAALKDNKITEAERERYTKLATADFENTAAILADKKPHVTASSQINMPGTQAGGDPYATWDYEKLSKEKPEVLAQIKETDPERFKKLREEYLKKAR